MNIFRRVTVFAKQHRLIVLFMYCVVTSLPIQNYSKSQNLFPFSTRFENLKIIVENFDPGSICFAEGL